MSLDRPIDFLLVLRALRNMGGRERETDCSGGMSGSSKGETDKLKIETKLGATGKKQSRRASERERDGG